MSDKPGRSWKDWITMFAIAAVLVTAFLAPAFVIRQQGRESDRIIARIEAESQKRLEQAIHVNTYTITCLLVIPPEERTAEAFRSCIREGFDQAPDIDRPETLDD